MLEKLSSAIADEAHALKLRAQRQAVLSANIVNADTPNYRAVDFDFAATLQQTIAEQGDRKGTIRALGRPEAGSALRLAPPSSQPVLASGGGLKQTHTAHLRTGQDHGFDLDLQFRSSRFPSLDGNTVDIEQERAMFAENAIQYEVAMKNLRSQIRSLQSAMGNSGSGA